MKRELLEKALSRRIRDSTTHRRLVRQLAESYEGSSPAGGNGYRRAIDHYREVLGRTEPGTPERERAASNLAELLRQLAEIEEKSAAVLGDAGFRRAIERYREAHALSAPGSLERLQIGANLAECLVRYPVHTPEELEEARRLLTAWDERSGDRDPVNRAAVLDLLGAIQLELPGDRAANWEEGIRRMEAADGILAGEDPARAGRHRAIVLGRLGLAYQGRPAGDEGDNLEAARRCFLKAAEVCPPELDEEEHYSARRNLAALGVRSRSLPRVHEAIQQLAAVKEHDERRGLHLDLIRDLAGIASLHLRAFELGSKEDLKIAEGALEWAFLHPAAKSDRYLEAGLLVNYGAIAIEDEAPSELAEQRLRRAVELADTLEGAVPMRARARYHLGRLLAARGEGDEALRHYTEAAEILEASAAPGDSAETLAEMGRQGGAIYEAAIDTLLRPEGRTSAAGGRLPVGEEVAAKALALLERNKMRSLGAGVARRRMRPSERVPEELRRAYVELLDEKRAHETRLRMNRFGRAPAWQLHEDDEELRRRYGVDSVHRARDAEIPYLEKRLREIAVQQEELGAKIREADPEFDPAPRWPRLSLPEIARLLPPARAILELVTTDVATYTFVLTAGGAERPALRVFAAARLDNRALAELVEERWLEPYRRYREAVGDEADEARQVWEEAVAGIGARLAELLGFDEILGTLKREKVDEIVLVPYRALHRLPLHLLPDGDGGYLCDGITVSYAPSLHVLAHAATPAAAGAGEALLVEDPDGSLVFGRLEIALARRFLERSTVLTGAECRGDEVRAAMKDAGIFHYCGHASFEQRNPLLSGLKLSDRTLTVAEIMATVDLSRCRLAVLSGCETAQAGLAPSADEYTGLPGAFLLAGAPTVIGTQWVLDDGAGPLFARELYRHLVELGASSAAAFGAALRRLRTITADEVLERFDDSGESEDPGLERLLLAARYRSDRSRPMFDEPRFWAAYALVGLP